MSRNRPRKSCLRVVFDTNTFSPTNFDVLESGPMQKLCKVGRIKPVYGHVFIEETLRAYGIDGKRSDLVNRWLPFIVGTCDRICDDFVGIWHKELVQGRGRKTSILMDRKEYEVFKSHLPHIPLDGTWGAWRASKAERGVEDKKKVAQREISKGIRAEVADWRKLVRYHPKKHGVANLDPFFRSEIEHGGREFIVSLVKAKDPRAIADRWSHDKMQYPYFTTFVFNMLYMAFHAATKHSAGIDPNAQADLDLMTHLLHADALVTNETGFLRTAFDDLWKPRGKVLFNSVQFAEFLQKL